MYTATRRELIEICQLVYDRNLTNAAGSNFSARASPTTLYLTPTGNAKRNRLRMTPDDLLLVDLVGNILEGKEELSRSWPTHRLLYHKFECVGAVIHAHPRTATAFSCQGSPMEAFLDAMKKYGPVVVLPRDLTVDGPEFGQAIVDHFSALGASFTKFGGAVLYPFHGALVAAPTLDDAFDLLERIEYNASAILFNHLLELGKYGRGGK